MSKTKTKNLIIYFVSILFLLFTVGVVVLLTNWGTQEPANFGVVIDDSAMPTYASTNIDGAETVAVVDLLGRASTDYTYTVKCNTAYNISYTVDGKSYSWSAIDITDIVTTAQDNVITLQYMSLLAVLQQYYDTTDIDVTGAGYTDIFILEITSSGTTIQLYFGVVETVTGITLDITEIVF